VIDRQEILELSREFSLRPDVVEKDYVLGWVLAGIYQHILLSDVWVFKGGTCLKKCFFETYRFSEDLDFTLTDDEHLKESFLLSVFESVAEWVYDASGIEIPADYLRFEVLENPRGGLSAQGRIAYRGPLQRRGDPPRIKLDLTTDETLIMEPVTRDIHHPYSDKSEKGMIAITYAFEEVFAEKLRALAERERPRDLYDVVHLFRRSDLQPDRNVLLKTLKEKCEFKGIDLPTVHSLQNSPERAELEREWANMLKHQLPVLPPFQQFWNELGDMFAWLYEKAERIILPKVSLGRGASSIDNKWRPPSTSQAWHSNVPIEAIRFAAVNRLCVDLKYGGSHRLIEAYSLRRTKQGALLLYAVKHRTGEVRSYRLDRIQGASVSSTPFKPRFTIELTPSGQIAAPPTSPPLGGWRVKRQISASGNINGSKYIYECNVCGREFAHSTRNSKLRKHKTTSGYPCTGRSGHFVRTDY